MSCCPDPIDLTPLEGSSCTPDQRILLLLAALHMTLSGCIAASSTPQVLVDITEDSGIHFWHDNGMTGELYFCETVGPGSAFLDFDGDGDLDVFLAQGKLLGDSKQESNRIFSPPAGHPIGARLYRNEGVDESGVPQFIDVTSSSMIDAKGYGMGCAVGDIEGDGDLDIYLTQFGDDQLWVNQGDGTFIDGTRAAGLGDGRWTTSAIFIDIDADGDEDLYVCTYIDFTLKNHKPCFSESSAVEYCGPSSYPPLPDRIYRNRGDGTFEDMTSPSGIGAQPGAGLGVVSSDLDADGMLDLYVANDGMANRLWRQVAPFVFEDTALLAGCAYNRDGRPEASMGADLADFDGDGDEDIFLTHLTGETNTLYTNNGKGVFDDESARSGLGVPSRRWTGFGTAWFDLENDGWLDLFVTNGAVKRMEERVAAGDPYPLDQPDQLFINRDGVHFEEIDPSRATVLQEEAVGRGAAFGDIDNDGDIDILVSNNCGNVRLLQNRIGSSNSWIGLDVRNDGGRVEAGIRCEIRQGDHLVLSRRARRGGSYLCSNDPRISVGLGERTDNCDITVFWFGGLVEVFEDLSVRRYHTLKRGEGIPPR